ncbi:hypothetical protein V6Z93_010512 [Aspergillus fumigatus]
MRMLAIFNTPVLQYLHRVLPSLCHSSTLISGQGALALYSKGKWKIWVRTVRILPKLSRRSLSLDHTALLHDMRRIVILSIEREQILDVDASTIYLYICFKTKMSACTLVLTMSNLTSRTSII